MKINKKYVATCIWILFFFKLIRLLKTVTKSTLHSKQKICWVDFHVIVYYFVRPTDWKSHCKSRRGREWNTYKSNFKLSIKKERALLLRFHKIWWHSIRSLVKCWTRRHWYIFYINACSKWKFIGCSKFFLPWLHFLDFFQILCY